MALEGYTPGTVLGGFKLEELIHVGGIYFVRDGHHRISVAKALGEMYVDAEVIEESC